MSNVALATWNAVLVAASSVFIVASLVAIRRRRTETHRACMLVATALQGGFSVLFVWRYVAYGPTPFQGSDVGAVVYRAVLVVHEPIAVVSVPLVIAALVLGLGRRFRAHRQVAGWAMATWLFSSVTGLAIYAFLYL